MKENGRQEARHIFRNLVAISTMMVSFEVTRLVLGFTNEKENVSTKMHTHTHMYIPLFVCYWDPPSSTHLTRLVEQSLTSLTEIINISLYIALIIYTVMYYFIDCIYIDLCINFNMYY